MSAASSSDADQQAEIERLKRRLAELETHLLETEARANRALIQAQERTYWLDRWGVDLNAVMKSRAAWPLRGLAGVIGAATRARRAGRPQSRRDQP